MARPGATRKRIVRFKAETTKGTAIAVDTTVLAFDAVVESPSEFAKRKPTGGYAGNTAAVIGMHLGRMRFRVEARGSGTALTAPGWAGLLEGCGMQVTAAVYTPATSIDDKKTLTIEIWEDGILKKLKGAMGTFRISAEVGGPAFFDFDFQGVWVTTTDSASMPTAPTATPIPPRFAGATLTLGGSYSPVISSLGIDIGNEVSPRENATAAAGFDYALVNDRDPSLTFNSEAELVATHDLFGKLIAGTEEALVAQWGGTAGNIIAIAAPAVQYTGAPDGDRGGKHIHDVQCQLNYSSGDDELSIDLSN
jgi:hypothetical protein